MTLFESKIQEQVKKRRVGLVVREGRHTIGEFVRATLSIDNPDEAREFYQGYLECLRSFPESQGREEQIAKSNIGWCFGEGMEPSKINMWVEIGASHPVFGVAVPTSEEAFSLGKRVGSKNA